MNIKGLRLVDVYRINNESEKRWHSQKLMVDAMGNNENPVGKNPTVLKSIGGVEVTF